LGLSYIFVIVDFTSGSVIEESKDSLLLTWYIVSSCQQKFYSHIAVHLSSLRVRELITPLKTNLHSAPSVNTDLAR
jgi:hypothetical protein